jgi:hypothetical protein
MILKAVSPLKMFLEHSPLERNIYARKRKIYTNKEFDQSKID